MHEDSRYGPRDRKGQGRVKRNFKEREDEKDGSDDEECEDSHIERKN